MLHPRSKGRPADGLDAPQRQGRRDGQPPTSTIRRTGRLLAPSMPMRATTEPLEARSYVFPGRLKAGRDNSSPCAIFRLSSITVADRAMLSREHGHIPELQSLRGIASIAVMVGHIGAIMTHLRGFLPWRPWQTVDRPWWYSLY